MSLDPSVASAIAVVALTLALVAVALAAVTLVALRRMRRDLILLQADGSAPSFVSAVARQTEQVRALRGEVDDLAVLLSRTRTELGDALRHVSVVRYDSFGDMGGRLSFSAALLDDGGDGLVLTAIHARSETRSYVKGVKAGQSDSLLSPEEQQAVAYALRGTSS